jgi:hypothetical protein
MRAAEALRRGAAPLVRAAPVVRRLEPWVVLVPLVLVQWAAVAAFAFSAERNGWLFYQGGDQTYYYTGAWLLANGEIPPAWVGHGWSVLLAPVAFFAGPNVLDALPAIVLLQVGLLLPLALLCVYGIAASFGGRLLGYAAAAAWIAAPFAVIPLWDERYHERYVELFLPQALGLTGLADFPSMVALLVSAFFVVRTMRTGAASDALLAGVAAGFAAALKPANLLFLAAPALALVLARRPRAVVLFAAAVAPSLATLALWKWLGLGHVPALAQPEARLAGGAGLGTALPPASILDPLTRYVELDWSNLHRAYIELREFFWSARLVQWLPLAGLVAVARRSIPTAGLLALWLGGFFVVKGTYELSTVSSGSIFRILMPAFPAYFVLAAAIPLLVPVLGPRLADRFAAAPPGATRPRRAAVAAAGVALVLVPLLVVAAAGQAPEERTALAHHDNLLLPVDETLAVELEDGMLRWSPHAGGTAVFYRVLRSGQGSGVACTSPGARARLCDLQMDVVTTTRATSWRVPAGQEDATYRVAVAANWRDDPELGDMLALSRAVAAARS